jgi:hypothetical protein
MSSGIEVVFARGINEKFIFLESCACPAAKHHKAKPIAVGHSTGDPAKRTDF